MSKDSVTHKWCPKCLHFKLRSEFYANKKNKDGLDYWCKDCRKKYISEWKCDNRKLLKHYRMPQEKDTEYKARHRAKHPDRHYARSQLLKARKNGLNLDRCSWPGCTETKKIEGHHSDYSKPYEIMSLCRLHHKAADLCGDKLGFDLPVIDISGYLKPSGRGRPRRALSQRIGVGV